MAGKCALEEDHKNDSSVEKYTSFCSHLRELNVAAMAWNKVRFLKVALKMLRK